jgi:hypothetical protein
VADAKEAKIPRMCANNLISAPDIDVNNTEAVNKVLTKGVKYSIMAESNGASRCIRSYLVGTGVDLHSNGRTN